MPQKYCPHCASANVYTFEPPIKCDKCKKEFATAFAAKITVNLEEEEEIEIPRKKKVFLSKKVLPAKRKINRPPVIEKDLTDDEIEELENEEVYEDEFDDEKQEIIANIDIGAIKINPHAASNRISMDDLIKNPDKYSEAGVRRFEQIDNTDYSKE